ncbi:MAG: cation:proton antiporter [Pseudomonadota bacterium]
MTGYLLDAVIYLMAAVVAVPLANRFGFGSVLGYLMAGIFIGPLTGLVGSETEQIQHFAEFGVVMMLFLVGLELEPKMLWSMRARLLGLGGLQVGVTALAIMGITMMFGEQWSVALTVGFILCLSSTAIVLQTLEEKGLMRTEGGQSSFTVLLFQDIAVIPILAIIPLLALPELAALASETKSAFWDAANWGAAFAAGAPEEGGGSMSLVDGQEPWAVALITLGAIGAVIFGGLYLSRPVFRYIAVARLREIFTAAALLFVAGIALLMTLVGLSPALGTFLAGVVLANSEFRHELESDIAPFKGLLLGLFFITVGAGIDFDVLSANVGMVVGLTLGVLGVKAALLFALGSAFRLRGKDRWLFAVALAQAGEFGFVLLSFSVSAHALPPELAPILSLVVAISMLVTPLMFIAFEAVFARKSLSEAEEESDEIPEQGSVIIAGLGRFGQVINRILLSQGHKTVVLDHQAQLIDNMRKFGVTSYYGDATRPDLLHAAGLGEAKVLVVAVDDPERVIEIVQYARRERPDLHIIARARDRHTVYALYNAGATDIVREAFDSSVRAGKYALEALGMHRFEVEKAAHAFVRFDRESLRMLASAWKPDVSVMNNPEYLALAKARNGELERALQGLDNVLRDDMERGWTPPPLRGEDG